MTSEMAEFCEQVNPKLLLEMRQARSCTEMRRVQESWVAAAEKKALEWLAGRTPRNIGQPALKPWMKAHQAQGAWRVQNVDDSVAGVLQAGQRRFGGEIMDVPDRFPRAGHRAAEGGRYMNLKWNVVNLQRRLLAAARQKAQVIRNVLDDIDYQEQIKSRGRRQQIFIVKLEAIRGGFLRQFQRRRRDIIPMEFGLGLNRVVQATQDAPCATPNLGHRLGLQAMFLE